MWGKDHDVIIGTSQAGLSISVTADLLGFSRTSVSRVYSEWCDKQKTFSKQQFCGQKHVVNERRQSRRGRLVEADRKMTVRQITMHYNSGTQKSISEHTECIKPLSGQATAAEDLISLINT